MKKLVALMILSGILIGMTGCKHENVLRTRSSKATEETNDTDPEDTGEITELANATTLYEVKDLMTRSEQYELYSECDNDDDLLFYFDALPDKEFIKVEHSGKEYLILWYYLQSYSYVGKGINAIQKTPVGNVLNVDLDIDLEGKQSQGCFPNITKYRLILELEKDFSEINIMGIDYTEYDGGQLIIYDKVGVVDKDLNIKIPFIFSGIYELDEYREKAIGKFYRVYLEGQGNGVYDKEYNEVLSPNYSNIYYVDDDRFIAMIFKSEVSSMNDNEIVLIDRDENILKNMNGFLEPVDTSSMKCCDDQMMYLLVGDDKLACYGIIDEELNVIIEAKYNSIYWMESEERYKVENKEGKIAFFDSDGNQLTEFTGQ